jgi:hypothetical protein
LPQFGRIIRECRIFFVRQGGAAAYKHVNEESVPARLPDERVAGRLRGSNWAAMIRVTIPFWLMLRRVALAAAAVALWNGLGAGGLAAIWMPTDAAAAGDPLSVAVDSVLRQGAGTSTNAPAAPSERREPDEGQHWLPIFGEALPGMGTTAPTVDGANGLGPAIGPASLLMIAREVGPRGWVCDCWRPMRGGEGGCGVMRPPRRSADVSGLWVYS